jgi:hypothetical protein
MNNWDERQKEVWGNFTQPQAPQSCQYADILGNWADEVVRNAEKSRDYVTILEAKIHLVDKFFSIRAFAPKAHRMKMSDIGHICIWNRFEEYFNRLAIAQLALTPPLFLPEPPAPTPPPPPRRAGGLFIAEIDDE